MNSEPILEVRHLNVWYRPSVVLCRGRQQVLHDVSFTIRAGTTFGILGATGSGKSTLVALLDRLYELPRENGQITIGGVDIREIDLSYLRKNIGVVLQEPFLFSKTFRESIADGAPRADLRLCATTPAWR